MTEDKFNEICGVHSKLRMTRGKRDHVSRMLKADAKENYVYLRIDNNEGVSFDDVPEWLFADILRQLDRFLAPAQRELEEKFQKWETKQPCTK
jgi:hypothetical protein